MTLPTIAAQADLRGVTVVDWFMEADELGIRTQTLVALSTGAWEVRSSIGTTAHSVGEDGARRLFEQLRDSARDAGTLVEEEA